MEAHAGKMDLQTVLCKYLHHLLLGGGILKSQTMICRGMVKFLKNDMLVCFGGLLHSYNGVNRATEQS